MRARYVPVAVIVLLALPGVGWADHRSQYGAIIAAAHAFDRAADHFHEVIHELTGYGHFADDVHEMAEEAHHFHVMVERGGRPHHLLEDFEEVERTYYHVERLFRRAHNAHHNRHILGDWRQVQKSFARLRHEMDYVGGEVGYDGWPDYRGQLIGSCGGLVSAAGELHRVFERLPGYQRHALEINGLILVGRRFDEELRAASTADEAARAFGALEEGYRKVAWEIQDNLGLGGNRELEGHWREVNRAFDQLREQVAARPSETTRIERHGARADEDEENAE